MTESYWHLLDEDEWAELLRSERLQSTDKDPIAFMDAVIRRGPASCAMQTEHALHPSAEIERHGVECSQARSGGGELVSLLACMGIPVHAVVRRITSSPDQLGIGGSDSSDAELLDRLIDHLDPLDGPAPRARQALQQLRKILKR